MKKQVLVKNRRGQKQTHKPPSLRGLIFAILTIMLLLPLIGKSQNSCSTAENDSPGSNTQEMTKNSNSGTYWFTFIGDSTKKYNFYYCHPKVFLKSFFQKRITHIIN